MAKRPAISVLLTGFPRLLVQGLAARILEIRGARVALLAAPRHADALATFLATLTPGRRKRVQALTGQLGDVDLGLDGGEVQGLLQATTHVVHAASTQQGSRALLHRQNVRSVYELLQLAADMPRLRRFGLISTVFVSGNRRGYIHEEELDCGQDFRTPYERTMFEAERIARAMMPRLPITVLRPGSMVGDTRTGQAESVAGPNYLMRLLVRLPAEVPLFLPSHAVVPLNIVPIDYVVRAGWTLLQQPETAGRTFHLTDPNPLSARRAFEILSELADRPAPMGGPISSRLVRHLLRLPGIGRLAPDAVVLLSDLTSHVTYSCAGTLARLAHTDIVCPPLESYADHLVRWVRQYDPAPARQ